MEDSSNDHKDHDSTETKITIWSQLSNWYKATVKQTPGSHKSKKAISSINPKESRIETVIVQDS